MLFLYFFIALIAFQVLSVIGIVKIFKENTFLKYTFIGFIFIGFITFLLVMFFNLSCPVWGIGLLSEIGFNWFILLPFIFLIILGLFILSSFKIVREKYIIKILGVCSLIVFLLFVYGRYNFYNIKVQEYKVASDNIKLKNNNIKIVAVSDLHLGNYITKKDLKRFINSINEQNPDVVFFVGDIIDRELSPVIEQQMEEEFAKLNTVLGKYLVFGNHESYGTAQKDEISDYYTKCGLTVLRDSVILVDSLFYLVGRDDIGHSKVQRKTTDDIIKTSIKDYNNNIPIIVLDHRPATFDEWNNRGTLEYNPFMVLSGHTHNGQVFPLNIMVKNMYPHHYGHFREGDAHYITSSGIGLWGPKFRLGTNSEIVVIDLHFNNINNTK